MKALLERFTSKPAARQTVPVPTPPGWRFALGKRILPAAVLFAVWAVAIEARLFRLQIVDHDKMVARAGRQQTQTRPLPAKRGDILDRKGNVLATSVDAVTVYAVPSAIDDEVGTVRTLCEAFADCSRKERQELIDLLRKDRDFAYVRRQIKPEVADRVAKLVASKKLTGIDFLTESHREYPNAELAAHVLGFVGIDGKGLSGLESAYDSQIRGKDGQVLAQADARRRVFKSFERPPTAGGTVETTVDSFLQYVAERELRAGVAENDALGGTAIIMDPHTGEVLAMANEPTFNPNAYRVSSAVAWRNRAVQDIYEPGSTFKLVTASAALEEKLMPVDTMIDVGGGRISIGPRVVHDTHDYGSLSFTDVIVKSSNVGAIKIGFKLGSDRLGDYVQRFGFGRPVSPDFPSESPGIVWEPSKWTDGALASVSMGYQVGVTPLQMASAVSAVANGGHYIEPRVVRALYKNGRRLVVRPKELRQIVTSETTASMTAIMEQVVERGTATLAKIPGYTIAGKTGTANKITGGRYGTDTYASFAGFLPANAPVATILVVIDSPRGPNGRFGGPVSAPIFRRIAEEVLRHMKVPRSIDPETPVLVAAETPEATVPTPVQTSLNVTSDEPGTVPDVRGLSARQAMKKLTQFGIRAQMHGAGIVTAQDLQPGMPVETGAVCTLTLARAFDKPSRSGN